MIHALFTLLILGAGYGFVLIKTKAPVVIHCFFIAGIALSAIGILSYVTRKRNANHAHSEKPGEDSGQVTKTAHDSVLGELRFVETYDNYWWETRIEYNSKGLLVTLAGKDLPPKDILESVWSLKSDMAQFSADIRQFLSDEATHDVKNSEDIRSLFPQAISFLWADKPGYAEIEFAGAKSGRLWSCGYQDGRLYNLSVSG